MNLLVLGPQGAGKGTQAKRISREHGIPHVSTGDMFRAEQEAGTEFGRRVGEIMATGQLVPDELTIAMIEERLGRDDARAGFVLDGFPRNLAQAEALDAMLGGIGRGLDAILFFDVPDEVGMERALRRAEIENRLDDTRDVIAKRLEIYHSETEPIVEHYRATGKLVPLHGERVDRRGLGRDLRGARARSLRWRARCDHPQVRGRDRDDGARRPRSSRRRSRCSRSASSRASRRGELDSVAEEFIRSRGGVPTFKGYKGYPAATCLSPNDMVVHGIPGASTLADGDILSVDVGVTLDGFVADSAWTFAVGSIAPEAQRLLDTCRAALEAGIEQAKVGNAIGDISQAVQTVTEAAGFSVIRSLVGHGVGRSMHEDPQVPNFVSSLRGPELKPGMTIAIEPMITAGSPGRLHPRRRLVDLDLGLVAGRPFRAHGGRHRGGAPHPDCSNGGPGTMTTRVARRLPACDLIS